MLYRGTIAILSLIILLESLRGQGIQLPHSDIAAIPLQVKALNGSLPLSIQFSPADDALSLRHGLGWRQDALTYVNLKDRSQNSIVINSSSTLEGRFATQVFLSNSSFATFSGSELLLCEFTKGKLELEKHTLPWKMSGVTCFSIATVDTSLIRVSSITGVTTGLLTSTFNPQTKRFAPVHSYHDFDDKAFPQTLFDTGSEICCALRLPKQTLTIQLALDPRVPKAKLEPLLTIKDGCISFQKVDDFYVVGSNAGRLCFLGADKKTEPLEANVLKMCIQQVVVRKGADGVYTCLVCGADEGESFAVAFVDTKNRTIKSQTFKIAAKPAKVLAAISHDGKTFALVDHTLKVSLFKAEQFQHIK